MSPRLSKEPAASCSLRLPLRVVKLSVRPRLLLLQELLHPVGHRLPVVEVRQDEGIAEAISTEPALIQYLPGGEGATTGVPGQAEQPHALLCRGCVCPHVAVDVSGQRTAEVGLCRQR